MRGMILATLMSTLVGAVLFAADDPGLKALEGAYKVEALSKGGTEVPEADRKKVMFVFKGDEMTLKTADRAITAKIAVDPTKMPHTIEFTPSDGPEKGKTFPGIYKIEDKDLTIAFNEKGERPTEFKAEGDVALMKLKKE